MQLHEDIELVIGDEWQITGTLLGENDQPLNLVQDIQISWTLLGPDGAHVSGSEGAIIDRDVDTTTGRLMITLPETLTKPLSPGRYTDAIRAWVGGAPAQMWRGNILAAADPFYDVI